MSSSSTPELPDEDLDDDWDPEGYYDQDGDQILQGRMP